MSITEKRAWIMVVVPTITYTVYVAIVLGRAGDGPLVHVSYVSTLLWSIGAAIVGAIVLEILVTGAVPKNAKRSDQRDREINRFGEYIGQSFVVIGSVAAMLMAMAKLEYFWIANVIYLGFVLSSLLGSIAKIVAYRRGFQSW